MTGALMPTYARADLAFEKGEGAWLVTTEGRRLLDFVSGVATNILGHANPDLTRALTEQAGRVWHISNLYRNPAGERLAERLCAASFADYVFFTNSGTEAIELSIKIARKYQHTAGHPERFRIITFDGAFHGRTLGSLSATGNAKYLEGFGPALDGFDQVPFGDLDAVRRAIGPQTAAILIEPVQGEGGTRRATPEFMKGLRDLADQHGLLLVLDEIQCGMGRSGKMWAYEWDGVTPDVMASAKGIGGGFPLGACLATAKAAAGMQPGTHGSTYGGNPLAMAVGNAVLDIVLADGFLEGVERRANLFAQQLAMIAERHPAVVEEIRGQGFLRGLKVRPPNTEVVLALREAGLLAVGAGDNVVRFLPPLNVTEDELSQAIGMIDQAFARLKP